MNDTVLNFVVLSCLMQPYATTFPIVSVDDMVHAFFLTLDSLGIEKVLILIIIIISLFKADDCTHCCINSLLGGGWGQ